MTNQDEMIDAQRKELAKAAYEWGELVTLARRLRAALISGDPVEREKMIAESAGLELPEPTAQPQDASPEQVAPVVASNDEVICPKCVHQFRAIPVNVQTQLAARDETVAAMVRWLEANQPDVFSRGLWDALNPAIAPAIATPTQSAETIDTAEFSALLSAYKVTGLRGSAERAALIAHIDARIAAARQEALASLAQPTDIAKRLRDCAADPITDRYAYVSKALLTQAADECDRYYGGMVNWKDNAQAKDRTIAELRAKQPAQALRSTDQTDGGKGGAHE